MCFPCVSESVCCILGPLNPKHNISICATVNLKLLLHFYTIRAYFRNLNQHQTQKTQKLRYCNSLNIRQCCSLKVWFKDWMFRYSQIQMLVLNLCNRVTFVRNCSVCSSPETAPGCASLLALEPQSKSNVCRAQSNSLLTQDR